MPPADPKDRLQPALLDRLTDNARSAAAPVPHPAHSLALPRAGEGRRAASIDPDRVMTKPQLREAVLRDLEALFNAVQPLDAATAAAFPQLADTVLNFGLPPLAGKLASKLDVHRLERTLRETLLRFEPRILPETLTVRALEATSVLDTHNVVEFEISGHLWSQPTPLEILLRTQIDLEAGQVRVRDAASAAR